MFLNLLILSVHNDLMLYHDTKVISFHPFLLYCNILLPYYSKLTKLEKYYSFYCYFIFFIPLFVGGGGHTFLDNCS